MHSFKTFVESIQQAVVQSSETISKRNEQIIKDYFLEGTEEVLLENSSYNKELLEFINNIKNTSIFTDFDYRNKLFSKELNNTQLNEESSDNSENSENYNPKVELNEEDTILYQILLAFTKGNNEKKIKEEQDKLFKKAQNIFDEIIIQQNKITEEYEEKRKKIEVIELDIQPKINEKVELEDNITKYSIENLPYKKETVKNYIEKVDLWIKNKTKITDKSIKDELKDINLFLSIVDNYKNLPNYLVDLQSYATKIEKQLIEFENLKQRFDILNPKIIELNKELDTLKFEIETLDKPDSSISNSYQIKASEVRTIQSNIDLLISNAKKLGIINNDDKIENKELVNIITSVKRYKKKIIETYVPKTVRVNYPATFDFATPDNDKEYKVISTPVEVPLLTLVPISTCNIEKATLKANFKFDVVDDEVQIEFGKDKINNNETSTNFGSLEIVLSPTQTPEGLKALIESYENFLKRQII